MMPLSVPPGAKVYLGAPANPMDPAITRSLVEIVASCPGIVEAHLPQCYIPNAMSAPAQVLVLVVSDSVQLQPIISAIGERISAHLPQGVHQDIWQMGPGDEMLQTVRGADCLIFESSAAKAAAPFAQSQSTKKWWKFW